MKYDRRNDRRRASAGSTSAGVLLGLLMIVTGVAIWFALPTTAGAQVRAHLLKKLREHYSDYYVEIDSARYQAGMGVIIDGLEIRDARRVSACKSVGFVQRIVVETDLSLQRLKEMDFTPGKLTLIGLRIKTHVDSQGRPTIEQFLPLPQLGPGADTIAIEDGQIEIYSDDSGTSHPLAIRKIHGTFHNRVGGQDDVKSVLLAAEASFAQSIDLQVQLDHSQWKCQLRFAKARWDDTMLQRLPARLTKDSGRIDNLVGLQAVFDGQFNLQGNLAGGLTHWQGGLEVLDGGYKANALPNQIRDLSGKFQLTPAGLVAQDVSARVGDSLCQAQLRTAGWKWPMPLELTFSADQFYVHRRVAQCTPEKCRQLFERLRPEGTIAGKADVHFDGKRWTWQANIDLLGIDIEFAEFPYPVRDVRGRVFYSDQETVAQALVGNVAGEPIDCSIRLARPNTLQSNVTVDVQIATRESITIDETLLQSLTPRDASQTPLETFARSLNPTGKMRIASSRFQVWADGSRRRSLDLRVESGNLRYDQFPYPIYDLGGQVLVNNDHVEIVSLRGQSNDSAVIKTSGYCHMFPKGVELNLEFDGVGIPMDHSLRRALNRDHQAIWDTLGPSGVLEHLHANLKLVPGETKPTLLLMAEQTRSQGDASHVVSITPESLPYRLDISRGRAEMIGEVVTITDLEGWHGQSRLNAEGRCARRDDGRWVLSVDVLPPTRMSADSDLITSLPEEVQETFRALQLYGPPVSMRGSTNFAFPNAEHPNLDFDWDMLFQLEGNRIGQDGPVQEIRGELQIAGNRIDQVANATGSVRFDSMHAWDVQLVKLQGPIVIRDDQLYFGQLAGEHALDAGRHATPSIQCQLFGGVAEMDGKMDLVSGRFDVNGRIDNVDFPTMLRDLAQPTDETSGRGRGVMRLTGVLGNTQTLAGQGLAHMEDASLYELPQMLRLMNLLSIKPNPDSKLSNCDMKFIVDGEEIHFKDMRIWGDILVLRGEGTANLRQELDFRFETGVSPNNLWSQLLRPLRNRQYSLWTIDVTGTLSNPIFDKRALKQIEQALERLFPDIKNNQPQGSGGVLGTAWRKTKTSMR